jgi:hypothetical protein
VTQSESRPDIHFSKLHSKHLKTKSITSLHLSRKPNDKPSFDKPFALHKSLVMQLSLISNATACGA